MELLLSYFPDMSSKQKDQFQQLKELYEYWNQRINVISRKDIEFLYRNHVLHSLSLAKFIQFRSGTQLIDLGTGGGFPAVPLAILFPEIKIIAMDGTQKKIQVVKEIISKTGLTNLEALHQRAEESKLKVDFVVSRAVTDINQLWLWAAPLINKLSTNALPNGLLCLKGGKLNKEFAMLPKKTSFECWDIYSVIPEEYFKEKNVCYVQK
ncbi:MAG: 16S rRNA (guanine(527)-N(7))-methyltransferase RsmG [Bacteroidota bacterium]|nr:16S rRNA (guanine(527)-N(7))-methyltransferase RsmG [Bacteroidota bacterium]